MRPEKGDAAAVAARLDPAAALGPADHAHGGSPRLERGDQRGRLVGADGGQQRAGSNQPQGIEPEVLAQPARVRMHDDRVEVDDEAAPGSCGQLVQTHGNSALGGVVHGGGAVRSCGVRVGHYRDPGAPMEPCRRRLSPRPEHATRRPPVLPGNDGRSLDPRPLRHQHHVAGTHAARANELVPGNEALHVTGNDRLANGVRYLRVAARDRDAEAERRAMDVARDLTDQGGSGAGRHDDGGLKPARTRAHDGDVVGIDVHGVPADLLRGERHRVALENEILGSEIDDGGVLAEGWTDDDGGVPRTQLPEDRAEQRWGNLAWWKPGHGARVQGSGTRRQEAANLLATQPPMERAAAEDVTWIAPPARSPSIRVTRPGMQARVSAMSPSKPKALDSFSTRATLTHAGTTYIYYSLARVQAGLSGLPVTVLPYSLKILLESLLRHEDGRSVTRADIETLARWQPGHLPDKEIAFMPARVLLQDFTGEPALVDLAAMRDAMAELGGDPGRIKPLLPAELVVDHSVQVDSFGSPESLRINAQLEFERNRERYSFLKWGQKAFQDFRVVPPATGIVHQVNLEYLARVVFRGEEGGTPLLYPDTLVGTDSHTTMVNGLGVLGWGVGGIEAEAAMLGQPMSLLIPEVIGLRLHGELRAGATATDLVLTVTQMLRARGVVGKFVEFCGPGLRALSLADRATVSNMAPEYGATCALFPIDAETLNYLRTSGRRPDHIALVEAYARAQGLFHTEDSPEPSFTEVLTLDLASVESSLAGPRRPQDRVPLGEAKRRFAEALPSLVGTRTDQSSGNGHRAVTASIDGTTVELSDGSIVIAAITSCTNTSNPSVMLGAGLLAKKAVERGLRRKPWVKVSLAPGSKVVTEYLRASGLLPSLEALGFNVVGYGCTTCIGNSGPLPEPVSRAVEDGNLVVAAVLSGNRNFEGRINPQVRANYLASPPLVVAYALAGHMNVDLVTEPLGVGRDGTPVFLKDIWPSADEIQQLIRDALTTELFTQQYRDVFTGDQEWRALPVPGGSRFAWDPASTYVRRPPFFENMSREPAPLADIADARVLVMLGDSVTTDHISPAGSIAKSSPAARYLIERGVDPKDFNSYGSRRGNDEVMVRGTFANVRLRNLLAPGTEGGWTRHLPGGGQMSIYDAAVRYRGEGVPVLVIAGKEYGSGSSRDWAAKGPRMLGVRVVIAESYERIHRSNLVGMGILPVEFLPGETRGSLGLSGEERYRIEGVARGLGVRSRVRITATADGGKVSTFEGVVRIDTPVELAYYRHGGVLPYVLRQLAEP